MHIAKNNFDFADFNMTRAHHAEILLLEIGKVAPEILNQLRPVIESTFGCRCITGAPLLLMPDYACVPRRNQYAAGAILERLPRDPERRALGVVDLDLFVPELNFVFGLADPNRGRAVIALPRLRESFYGGRENQALFLERTAKEAIHELGHTYGLGHCRNRDCVMSFSNSLLDTDRKSQRFCKRCTRKLQV
jgi:archaemetzincin